MARLINADALPRLTQIFYSNGKRIEQEVVLAKIIDTAPIVDAAPVRRGRWVDSFKVDAPPTLRSRWTCSLCGNVQTYGVTDYCPNCGARMDGEDDA